MARKALTEISSEHIKHTCGITFLVSGHGRLCKLLAAFLLGLAVGKWVLEQRNPPMGPRLILMNYVAMTRGLHIRRFPPKSQPQPSLSRFAVGAAPWQFIDKHPDLEVKVTIPVPPATKGADVNVRFQYDALFVAVKGHDLQPSIVDGELPTPIDPVMSTWMLEGADADRRLILDMVKKEEKDELKRKWVQLLKPMGEVQELAMLIANSPVRVDIIKKAKRLNPKINQVMEENRLGKDPIALAKHLVDNKDDPDWGAMLAQFRDITAYQDPYYPARDI